MQRNTPLWYAVEIAIVSIATLAGLAFGQPAIGWVVGGFIVGSDFKARIDATRASAYTERSNGEQIEMSTQREKDVDRQKISIQARGELEACEHRAIAPGRRTITHFRVPVGSNRDFADLYHIESELPGYTFAVGYTYRKGDARLLAACRELFGLAVYMVDRYKGQHIEAIEPPALRELVRRARSAALLATESIITDGSARQRSEHKDNEGG